MTYTIMYDSSKTERRYTLNPNTPEEARGIWSELLINPAVERAAWWTTGNKHPLKTYIRKDVHKTLSRWGLADPYNFPIPHPDNGESCLVPIENVGPVKTGSMIYNCYGFNPTTGRHQIIESFTGLAEAREWFQQMLWGGHAAYYALEIGGIETAIEEAP